MAAISYLITPGGVLETVTAGTNAPSAAGVELRIDQTTTTVTDGLVTGGTRALKRGEVDTLLGILRQYLLRDTSLNE